MRTIVIDADNLQARWKNHFWNVVSINVATQTIVIEDNVKEETHDLSLSEVELHLIIEK